MKRVRNNGDVISDSRTTIYNQAVWIENNTTIYLFTFHNAVRVYGVRKKRER